MAFLNTQRWGWLEIIPTLVTSQKLKFWNLGYILDLLPTTPVFAPLLQYTVARWPKTLQFSVYFWGSLDKKLLLYILKLVQFKICPSQTPYKNFYDNRTRQIFSIFSRIFPLKLARKPTWDLAKVQSHVLSVQSNRNKGAASYPPHHTNVHKFQERG